MSVLFNMSSHLISYVNYVDIEADIRALQLDSAGNSLEMISLTFFFLVRMVLNVGV